MSAFSRPCVDDSGVTYRRRLDTRWISVGDRVVVVREGKRPGDRLVRYGEDPWIKVGDAGTVQAVHAGYDDGPGLVAESWARVELDTGATFAIGPDGEGRLWKRS